MPIANIFGSLFGKGSNSSGGSADPFGDFTYDPNKSWKDNILSWGESMDPTANNSGSSSDSSSGSTTPDPAGIITKYIETILKLSGSDTVKDSVIENLVPGSTSSDGSNVDKIMDELKAYFDGLMTNQGKENELNRQFNSAEAALNREFQSSEAQLQRDWYEAMSNTAYQRSMADMKAAGLNPMLAYAQGGAASSGTGVSAGSAASYSATGGDTLSSLLSAASDVIDSVAYSSASKVNKAFKLIKMLGG